MLIEIENLSHIYATNTPLERTALSNVNLSIGPGERVGIAGQTGSGKSTLMQHLAGLLQPSRGRVLLDGVPAHQRTPPARQRRRRVGIAFQYPEEQIFEQTVFDEVAFGPRNLGLEAPEIAARVRWALELVDLSPEIFLDRSPFTLSGGEMRRVALAGVLALQSEVLILDEPTAGLDPRGRRALLERVEAWQEEGDRTLIIVSHDLASLARLTDRAILLKRGTVAADGPSRQVLGSVETLDAACLKPPSPVMLLHELQRAGWDIRTDRLHPEEAAAEIAAALARERSADSVPEASR
jgi:energy-coupling factor transport system ATP-binding protein